MSEFQNTPKDPNEELSLPLKILSFCIPLAGAILFFVYRTEQPAKAKTACYAALIGLGVAIVLNIILTVLGIGAGAMGSY